MSEKIKNVRYALVAMLLFFCAAVQAQTVSGNVKDGLGDGVIGATIMEQGTKNGTVTDMDGNFTIKLQGKSNKLQISYVGMKSKTVDVAGKTSVNVMLEDDNTTLNDLVVVGYGTMKKSDVTGSVSSVNTEQLNAKGAPSVMENLQGSTPGVNITQSSGRAGGDFNIEIRGKSSINSDTKPIYVVDGVICDDINWLNAQDIEKIDVLKDASSTAIYGSQATAGVVMVTTKGGATVKKGEKVNVSYDGYYGWTNAVRMPDFMSTSEFARYRLMEYTKRSTNGADSASPSTYVDPGSVNTDLLMKKDGTSLINSMLASGESYNWPDIVTNSGMQQNHYLAVNGSSETVRYHFGLGYNAETGIYNADKKKQITFKGSVDAKISKYVNAGFTANLARITNEYADDYAVQEAYYINPFVKPYYTEDVYDADGNLTHAAGETIHRPAASDALGTSGDQFSGNSVNPLDVMRNSDKSRKTWRALGNLYVEVKPFEGLSFKSTFSPNYTNYRDGYYYGYTDTNLSEDSHFWGDRQNSATTTSTTWNSYEKFSWTWDNVVTYITTIADKHSLNVMGLFSSQKNTIEKNGVAYNNVIEGTQWYNTANGEYDATNSDGTSYTENSMLSWALRANYGFMDRYLLTATVRWDGSSKFAKNNRWGSFPSVAFAWRATEEEFLKKVDWLSNLKVRLSYGVTGNNKGVGDYATVSNLSSTKAYYSMGSTYYTGSMAGGVVDAGIKWEKSYEFNAGVDFGFLRNRINGTIDWYTKKSEDLLARVSLPSETGWTSGIYTNIGSVKNTGIEFSLTGVIFQNKDWNWTVTTNWSHNRNKVLKLNGEIDATTGKANPILSGSVTSNYFVGYSVNNVYTYEIGGIASDRMMTVPDNKATELAGLTPGTQMKEYEYYNKTQGCKEGQAYMVDVNNDGQITSDDKKVYESDPSWIGSLTSNLSYKGWDLGVSLYMRFGGYAYSNFMGSSKYFDYSDRGVQHYNMDYYIPAGTLVSYDGINADGTYINPVYQTTTQYGTYPFPADQLTGTSPYSSFWNEAKGVTKINYMKVKNITLGYTFPKSLLQSWGCKYLRLYFTVTNPFVITKYKGYDPEWADASLKNDGPSTVSYQIGASIKF